MTTLKDALRLADPLAREPGPPEARVAQARRRAVVAVGVAGSRAARPVARRHVLVAGAVTAAAVAAGVAFWRGGLTPVLAAVRFEIRLAEEAQAPGLREAPVGSDPRLVYLHEAIVVSNDHIATARVVAGRDAEHFDVEVVFTPGGARRMAEATRAHIGRPVALLVDGLVVMAPTVRSAIGDRALLTGDYTRAEAERIAAGMLVR